MQLPQTLKKIILLTAAVQESARPSSGPLKRVSKPDLLMEPVAVRRSTPPSVAPLKCASKSDLPWEPAVLGKNVIF